MEGVKQCLYCKEFYVPRKDKFHKSKYCTVECFNLMRNEKPEIVYGELLQKTVPCDNCGGNVTKPRTEIRNTNFCDMNCYKEHLDKTKKKQIIVSLWCSNCEKTFDRDITKKGYPTSERTFCTSECQINYQKNGGLYPKVGYYDEGEVTVECKACGKDFTYEKKKKTKVRKTCTRECQTEYSRKNKG